MQFLWKYIEDLVGKGLEWTVIAELLFYAWLVLVPMALPLAVLLASIMTFGNLGESNELFAMKSGGISLYRIMFPVLIISIIISLASFFFSNNILPYTNLKMRSLLMSIQQQRPEISIQSGIFSEPVENFSIRAEKDRKSDKLKNILIYDHRNQTTNSNVTTAEHGNINITEDKSFLILDLNNGYRFEELSSNKNANMQYQRSRFEHQVVYIQLDGLGLDRNNEDFFKNNFDMINNQQIVYSVDSLKNNINNRYYTTCKNTISYYMLKNLPTREKALVGDIKPFELREYKHYDIDSIFNSFTSSQNKTIIERTITDAKSVKINIEIMKEEAVSTLRWIARYEIEWHRKYTYAIACLIFFIIGASLGAIIRKGGFGVPVIVSIGFFLLYYILSIAFENTVRELVFSSEIGMWISTLFFALVAIVLNIKATNETIRIGSRFRKIFRKK
jgi:lipopolysaccharide export system permease protein